MTKRDKGKKKSTRKSATATTRMKRRDYEAALRPLQAELCHLS
jgi:hypothetical protein